MNKNAKERKGTEVPTEVPTDDSADASLHAIAGAPALPAARHVPASARHVPAAARHVPCALDVPAARHVLSASARR